jgi:hypothetical protein
MHLPVKRTCFFCLALVQDKKIWSWVWGRGKQNILRLVFVASPLRSKSKDWLARNQDNVSEWSNMSFCGLLFQSVIAVEIQLSVLVWYKVDIIIISLNATFSRHDLCGKLLSFMGMFCRSLFVLLSFFLWPWYCMSFGLQILIPQFGIFKLTNIV